MHEKPLPPGVHVVLGGSAGGTFRRVFHPRERLIVDNDVLCCGPTPRCDPAAWVAVRDEYWNPIVKPLGYLAEWPSNLVEHAAEFSGAERITIWAATSLSEQLFIAHVIQRATEAGATDDKLLIVQYEHLRGSGTRIFGMGELNEKYMSEHPDPVPISTHMLGDYRDLWAALTSTDPLQMDRFADTHPGAGPWLTRVPALMRRRFPDRKTGLAFWDRMLLRAARDHGPNAARVVGHAMVEHWGDGDITGDWYLFGRLSGLADPALPNPLVKFSGGEDMRSTRVELTAFGREVLEGRESNYPANPIEEWTAGVRLSSRDGLMWFDEGERLVRG